MSLEGRGLRLFGHPLHASSVHLPIGLWIAATVGDVLALATADAFWWRAAFWALAGGLAAAVVAAVAGFVDYLALSNDAAVERTAMRHLTVMATAMAAYAASLALRGAAVVPEGWRVVAAVGASGVGLVALLAGGWLGGELVYRHGVQVGPGSSSSG